MIIKQIIIFGCLLSCLFFAGFTHSYQVTDPSLWRVLEAQKHSLKILGEYFSNPHPLKRLEIEKSEALTENLPTRIYQAWRMYTNKGYPPEVSERIRHVLFQNPKLSLLLLKPIISEPSLSEQDMFVLTEQQGVFVPYDEKNLYINFCTDVAVTEKDGFAHNILRDLSRLPDKHISKQAHEALEYLKTENYRYKSAVYKKTGDWKSLHWLTREYFKPDMSAEDVQDVLGKGKQINSNTYVYRGKQDHYLWLFFNDGLLESWEWRDKDKIK